MTGSRQSQYWWQFARLVFVGLSDVSLSIAATILFPLVIMVVPLGLFIVLIVHARERMLSAERAWTRAMLFTQSRMPFPDAQRGRILIRLLSLVSLAYLVQNFF